VGDFAQGGQDLGVASLTDIYTCPVDKTTKLRIVFCNRAATPTTIRLSIARAGAADSPSQYLIYDRILDANDSLFCDEISVEAADVVRAYSALPDVSANVMVADSRRMATT
jgi:hypothetical protein